MNKYKVLTKDGFVDFCGITKSGLKEVVSIVTSAGELRVSKDHRLFSEGKEKLAKNFVIGDRLDTDVGPLEVLDITIKEKEEMYELIDVQSSDHTYYIQKNGVQIISHNCDELDFVPPSIAEGFWTGIQPTLSTGGSCIISSTPQYEDGVFASIWNRANHKFDDYGNPTSDGTGANGFYPLFYTWAAHPERDENWRRATLASLNNNISQFQQEHECVFMSNAETLIDPIFMAALKAEQPQHYIGQVRWYSLPRPNTTHIVILDPSTGTGSDYAAIQVFEADTMTQIAEWQHNKTPIRKQISILKNVIDAIYSFQMSDADQIDEPRIYWSFENNGIGEAALVVIEDNGIETFSGQLVSDKGKNGKKRRKGLFTTSTAKFSACLKFKSLVESKKIHIKSEQLIAQLKKFQSGGGSFKGAYGSHDDLVMATVIAVRVFMMIMNWIDDTDSFKEILEDDESEPLPTIFG